MLNVSTLESAYLHFIKDKKIHYSNKIEFLGINLYDNYQQMPIFKIYYNDLRSQDTFKKSMLMTELISLLLKRNMVRSLNLIHDTVNYNCLRYEIGLINRTNNNMNFVYSWLFSTFPTILKYKDEITAFKHIPCSRDKEYKLASLYFLGIIVNSELSYSNKIEAIKLHYLLRNCENINRINKNYIVDNDYYLYILTRLEISQIKIIASFIMRLKNTVTLELWIAGVDYYHSTKAKYKIYFKKFSEKIYEKLISEFYKINCVALADNIHTYRQWLKLHPELEQYGIAICLDTCNQWSINFYH